MLCLLVYFWRFLFAVFLGMGMMPNNMMGMGMPGGPGRGGHFNPAFVQGGAGAFNNGNAMDGPRKRFRTEES